MSIRKLTIWNRSLRCDDSTWKWLFSGALVTSTTQEKPWELRPKAVRVIRGSCKKNQWPIFTSARVGRKGFSGSCYQSG